MNPFGNPFGPAGVGEVIKRREDRPDWDPTSTNPRAAFPKDDRPLKVEQDPVNKGKWRTIRVDPRYEEGGRIIAQDVTKGEADFYLERTRMLEPRTDRTRKSATTATFYGFNVPDGLFDDGR